MAFFVALQGTVMGNDLVFKIAVGVFLGMGAWTYRSDLGTMALYGVGIILILFAIYMCYLAIANPIKNTFKEQAISKLVFELDDHKLIDSNLMGALTMGLQNADSDDDFQSLTRSLEEYKRDLRNGENGSFYKSQIATLTAEIVEEFKLRGVQS